MNDRVKLVAPTDLIPLSEPKLPAVIPDKSLDDIAKDIRRSHAEAIAGLSHFAEKAIQAGSFC